MMLALILAGVSSAVACMPGAGPDCSESLPATTYDCESGALMSGGCEAWSPEYVDESGKGIY